MKRRPPQEPTKYATYEPSRHPRAEQASDGARYRDHVQSEAAAGDQVARERHDDFGRQRDACAFDRHHQDDPAVAERRNRRDDEGGEPGNYFIEHFPHALYRESASAHSGMTGRRLRDEGRLKTACGGLGQLILHTCIY